MGYRTTFETEDEFCYVKHIETKAENLVNDKNLSNTQYENCNLSATECYQVNLEGSAISNSHWSDNKPPYS
jgi:uncharacterized protein YjbI with pentapeptide repeats